MLVAWKAEPAVVNRGSVRPHTLTGIKDISMLDLLFVALGAALFLGALAYARACANV